MAPQNNFAGFRNTFTIMNSINAMRFGNKILKRHNLYNKIIQIIYNRPYTITRYKHKLYKPVIKTNTEYFRWRALKIIYFKKTSIF